MSSFSGTVEEKCFFGQKCPRKIDLYAYVWCQLNAVTYLVIILV